jgi:ribosome recycling factor
MKSDNTVTEDGQRDFEAEVQALTDKATKDLDALVTAKEKEVMTV